MQLLVIMTFLGLMNIVGVGLTSDADMAHQGVNKSDYRGTVEVEQVSSRQPGSLIEAIDAAGKK